MITVGIFLAENLYSGGFSKIIQCFLEENPTSLLNIKYYPLTPNFSNTLEQTKEFLKEFQIGNRITISESTFVLTQMSNYFDLQNQDIPCISISATSPSIKQLRNVLTYAHFDIYSVQSQLLLATDYRQKHFFVIIDQNATEYLLFFNTYIDELKKQAHLLNFDVEVSPLEYGKTNYPIKPNTVLLLLATNDTLKTFITPTFLRSLPSSTYITLTDLNQEIEDIFEYIPAVIFIPTQINNTETTARLYITCFQSTTIIPKFYYSVYAMYDILYTLNFINQQLPDQILTLQLYTSINPFVDFPASWSNAVSYNIENRGSIYGMYCVLFTKNILVGKNTNLYLSKFEGGLPSSKDSVSVLRIIGIVPFYQNKIYYDECEYYKIYENKILKAVKFGRGLCRFESDLTVNTNEFIDCKFIVSFDSDEKYFTKLIQIFNLNCPKYPQVNPRMSKKTFKKGIFRLTK